MNILERGLLLAIEIKKTRLALDLKENKRLAKNSIDDIDWSLFSNAATKEHGYSKFPIGLEIIKSNNDNDKEYIRESVKNILKSKDVLNFSENMYEFKKIINEIIYSVSKPYFLENSVLFENQDVEREYRLFYIDFIRLGVVQRLLSYKVYRNFNDSIKKIQRLNKDIEHLHFWNKEVINEINKVSANFEERKILTVSNILTSIISLIEQVIYENHFDKTIYLDVNDLQIFNKSESVIEGLIEFELEVNIGCGFDNIGNDGWIIFLKNEEYLETLLITNKTLKFIPENKAIFKGVIYPDNDRVFIEDYIKNTK
ncbi:hypothetical protein FDC27_01975 [Clostridium botulinum]|nr:hypothetical protein [Clostridium botulinum]NFL57952.1 hypothetical protein [Clostridium botulinum]NFL61486.1 hypothetical protein [Clostridium botulinum]NFO65748.1 hypothetical protein [Clostridium botulinum]